MTTLLMSLMVTWTDIFEGIGKFFEWCFGGMRALEHIPNFIFGSLVIFGIVYWCYRIAKYRKAALRNSTYE
jgi:hypothetical protein